MPTNSLLATDFRSDTITHPTTAMYDAIGSAALGDDVFGDDPTVHALEREAAAKLGMEAALLTPSGTMANNIAMAVATRPGDEIILMPDAHTYLFEQGGSARLWGLHARTIEGADGCPAPERIEEAVRHDDPHFPRTSMVLIENTHNMQGGRVVSAERIDEVSAVCRRHGLTLHLDGARLFNAAVALGQPIADLTRNVDSVMVSLSKGLRCPVGSIYASDASRVREARRVRKLLGGGMRQAGILAACGRVALEDGVDELAQDHEHARTLALGLASIDGVRVEPDPPETNIVMVELDGPDPGRHAAVAERLERDGIRLVNLMNRRLRLVTHAHIDDDGIQRTLESFGRAMREQ